MNQDILMGKWHEIKGKVKAKWAKLTDDDIEKIGGNTEVLLGKLQKTYGLKKEVAEKEIKAFTKAIH